MGIYINGVKTGMPYINGVKHNVYINGQKIGNSSPVQTELFKFLVADAGSFNIPVSGVNGGSSAYQSYNWIINWGDGNIQIVSGTGSSTETIAHTYSDGVGSHTITIKPNGTATQGWFNAFGSSSSQTAANLAKIKQLYSPITSLMRTMNDYACYSMFYKCTGLTALPSGFLPATTLAISCYNSMFCGCTELTSLPSNLLHSTNLFVSCYDSMFNSCTKLSNIGNINAAWFTAREFIKQAAMFSGCTAIATPITYANIPEGWK